MSASKLKYFNKL